MGDWVLRPTGNKDHKIEINDPNDPDTWVVIKGTKPLKLLLKEMVESQDRNWKDKDGNDLLPGQLKAIANQAKAFFKLQSVTIRGQTST